MSVRLLVRFNHLDPINDFYNSGKVVHHICNHMYMYVGPWTYNHMRNDIKSLMRLYYKRVGAKQFWNVPGKLLLTYLYKVLITKLAPSEIP